MLKDHPFSIDQRDEVLMILLDGVFAAAFVVIYLSGADGQWLSEDFHLFLARRDICRSFRLIGHFAASFAQVRACSRIIRSRSFSATRY